MFDNQKPHQPDDREQLPDELASLERQLQALIPGVPRIDRDRLMFEAGRAAALAVAPISLGQSGRAKYVAEPSQSGHFWQISTFLSMAASVALALMLVQQRSTERSTMVAPQFAVEQPNQLPGDLQFVAIPRRSLEHPGFWTAWIMPLPPASGYIAKRDAVLHYGPSAIENDLPRLSVNGEASSTPSPVTVRELMEEYLPGSTQDLDTSVLLP